MISVSGDRFPYRVFLLRIWPANGEAKAAWRASLEDPRTRQVKFFPSLEALFSYLQQELGRKEEVLIE